MRLQAVAVAVVAFLAGCAEPASTDLASNATDVDAGTAVATFNGTATDPADLTGGHAPHIHDYWGVKDRVVVFDDTVDVAVLSQATFYNVFMRADPALGGTFWTLPEGQTVYEGTGQLEITASWTDPTITGLGMAYKPADRPTTRNQFKETAPLDNGQVFAIEVTPQMTDMPHEAVSRWEFYFAGTGTPALAQGAVHLKVELVRMRDVTLFPGHPDNYEDTDRYLVEDADFAYKRPSVANFFLDALQGKDTTPIVPDHPVPMETRVLIVELTITSTTSVPGSSTEGYDLLYRNAAGDRYVAQLLDAADPKYTYGIPVGDAEVDSPYHDGSAWRLAPMPRTTNTLPVGCEFCVDVEVTGHAIITAYAVDPTGQVTEEREEI